jgi:hypothetical protein
MLTDCLNEECLEFGRAFACKGAHTLFTSQGERGGGGGREGER